MFPVYTYQEGMELPEEGNYYLVSGNGLWLHKDTGIVKAFIPVESISVLEDLDADAFVQCKLPKISAHHIWRIKTFFKKVVEIHRSEASTTLYYNKTTKEFKIHVPKQKVSHSSVNYKREALSHVEEFKDFLCVGTIHSHCDFAAFHSNTDVSDEEDFDGLHCTFGHNNQDEFSISATIVVNNLRLKIDPLDVLEGIEPVLGKEERYKLADISPELEAEWRSGILEEWMPQVSSGIKWKLENGKFKKGDQVNWAGDLSTVSFKEMCGEGPFEVDCSNEEYVTVVTKVGLARFSEKLFKRA